MCAAGLGSDVGHGGRDQLALDHACLELLGDRDLHRVVLLLGSGEDDVELGALGGHDRNVLVHAPLGEVDDDTSAAVHGDHRRPIGHLNLHGLAVDDVDGRDAGLDDHAALRAPVDLHRVHLPLHLEEGALAVDHAHRRLRVPLHHQLPVVLAVLEKPLVSSLLLPGRLLDRCCLRRPACSAASRLLDGHSAGGSESRILVGHLLLHHLSQVSGHALLAEGVQFRKQGRRTAAAGGRRRLLAHVVEEAGRRRRRRRRRAAPGGLGSRSSGSSSRSTRCA
mmetsp:Transcript_15699/g.37116  ORF Transcript_15699/g.37116 Transcript_15699/m.37116 type:complete len:279 (+) Transcript_15699:248-1084(+)